MMGMMSMRPRAYSHTEGDMIMRRRVHQYLRIILACLLLATFLAPTALATTFSARINTTTKVYKAPKKSSKSVKVAKNRKVTLTATSGGWAQITIKNKTVYIPIKYLTLTDPIEAYVTVKSTMFKKPGGKKKMGKLAVGQVVYVIGVNGKYARVINKARTKKGYVKAANLSQSLSTATGGSGGISSVPENLRSTTTSPDVSKIEYTIYMAQNLIGKPYAENPDPPNTFDCAFFTRWCYNKAQSDTMKDSSKSQGYDDRYAKIEYSDLKRGDLVCFNTIESDNDDSDHVGIYIGDGYFIHASSAGNMVIVSQMVSDSSDYYKRTFSWGRRIFES